MSEEAETGSSFSTKPTTNKKTLPHQNPKYEGLARILLMRRKIITNLSLRDIMCIINLHCIWLLKSICVSAEADSRAVV